MSIFKIETLEKVLKRLKMINKNNMKEFAEGDLVPVGQVIFGPGAKPQLPKLTSSDRRKLLKAKNYAMDLTIEMNRLKQNKELKKVEEERERNRMARQQAFQLMCRLYIGSINFEVKEESIRKAFLPFGPIKSISMSWDPVMQRHKGYAFIDYELPESAQLALDQMNNAFIGGRNIKVISQSSNMTQAQPIIEEIKNDAKNNYRIYIASIHPEVTEKDFRDIFEAFGSITFCKFVRDTVTQKHKEYGFIEYESSQAVNEAIAGMNLFNLGGKSLRVGHAITPLSALHGFSQETNVMPSASVVAAAAATAKLKAMNATAKITLSPSQLPPPGIVIPQLSTKITLPTVVTNSYNIPVIKQENNLVDEEQDAQTKHIEKTKQKLLKLGEPESLQEIENMTIKGYSSRQVIMQKLMRNVKSSVVILKNMVGPEDVDDSLQEEIKEECEKFGELLNVVIFQEKQTDSDDAEVIIKIFLHYKAVADAERARNTLNGRYFGGRIIEAREYDQALFDFGDYSG